MDYGQLILEFLNVPLDRGDAILERFAALPGAVSRRGSAPLQRYVYLPGTRKDRVVLVAHADTVWDRAYGRPDPGGQEAVLEDGVFRGTNPACGIGADCRAGCAMLWALKDSGHSILVVDGEEYGKHGANYLKKGDRSLFRELNRHCYMLELDWAGTGGCLFNQVDNTKKFKRFVETELGFSDGKADGGCDLEVLCRRICGANLGVGYHGGHTARETLVLAEWEHTLHVLREFLAGPQRKFRLSCVGFCRRAANKVLRCLKRKK